MEMEMDTLDPEEAQLFELFAQLMNSNIPDINNAGDNIDEFCKELLKEGGIIITDATNELYLTCLKTKTDIPFVECVHKITRNPDFQGRIFLRPNMARLLKISDEEETDQRTSKKRRHNESQSKKPHFIPPTSDYPQRFRYIAAVLIVIANRKLGYRPCEKLQQAYHVCIRLLSKYPSRSIIDSIMNWIPLQAHEDNENVKSILQERDKKEEKKKQWSEMLKSPGARNVEEKKKWAADEFKELSDECKLYVGCKALLSKFSATFLLSLAFPDRAIEHQISTAFLVDSDENLPMFVQRSVVSDDLMIKSCMHMIKYIRSRFPAAVPFEPQPAMDIQEGEGQGAPAAAICVLSLDDLRAMFDNEDIQKVRSHDIDRGVVIRILHYLTTLTVVDLSPVFDYVFTARGYLAMQRYSGASFFKLLDEEKNSAIPLNMMRAEPSPLVGLVEDPIPLTVLKNPSIPAGYRQCAVALFHLFLNGQCHSLETALQPFMFVMGTTDEGKIEERIAALKCELLNGPWTGMPYLRPIYSRCYDSIAIIKQNRTYRRIAYALLAPASATKENWHMHVLSDGGLFTVYWQLVNKEDLSSTAKENAYCRNDLKNFLVLTFRYYRNPFDGAEPYQSYDKTIWVPRACCDIIYKMCELPGLGAGGGLVVNLVGNECIVLRFDHCKRTLVEHFTIFTPGKQVEVLAPFENELELLDAKEGCYFIVHSSDRYYLSNATTGRVERALQGDTVLFCDRVISVRYHVEALTIKTRHGVCTFDWRTGFRVPSPPADASAMNVDPADVVEPSDKEVLCWPSGHPMTPSARTERWMCNGCGAPSADSTARFRCDPCQFDYCSSCFAARQAGVNRKCGYTHAVLKSSQQQQDINNFVNRLVSLSGSGINFTDKLLSLTTMERFAPDGQLLERRYACCIRGHVLLFNHVNAEFVAVD